MRNKFRAISELFDDDLPQRRFKHTGHDAEWVAEYENQVNSLIDSFCDKILIYNNHLSFQTSQDDVYEYKIICNKIVCTISCAKPPYLYSDNNYGIVLTYKYFINSVLQTIEKTTSYDTLPISSDVRDQLIDWFGEIDVNLDDIQDSEPIQSSGPGDANSVLEYDHGSF